MSAFENGTLKTLFDNIQRELDNTQAIAKNMELIFCLQDVVAEYAKSSPADQKLAEEMLMKNLETMRERGLNDKQIFVIVRNLSHNADRAVKTTPNPATTAFSERFANLALLSFISASRADALTTGEDPDLKSFNDLAAARVQATGTVGVVFRNTYEIARDVGKLPPAFITP